MQNSTNEHTQTPHLVFQAGRIPNYEIRKSRATISIAFGKNLKNTSEELATKASH